MSFKEALQILHKGGQIVANTGQYIRMINDTKFILECDTPGCCNAILEENEVKEMVEERDLEWIYMVK
jgi:hypothetical protein